MTDNYCDVVKSFHNDVRCGNFEVVRSFLESYQLDEDHYLYNDEMESAAAIAIKQRRIEIYELLLSFGLYLGPHERMNDLLDGESSKTTSEQDCKANIHNIHKKYFKDSSLKHVQALISKSKLSHDASMSDRSAYFGQITKAFEDLNSLKLVEPILKIASTDAQLKLVFDFIHDTVDNLDPAKKKDISGTTYTKDNYIYVGAKGLVDGSDTQVLATLAHEMCHFVINRLYKNNCKPYLKSDQEKKEKFDEVVKITNSKKFTEEIIDSVYTLYPTAKHHAELIVRVPHLEAFYKDDQEKFIKISKAYTELFHFYEKNTFEDLKKSFPVFQAKREIREVNDVCRTLAALETSDIELSSEALNIELNANDNILIITSNCPKFTMRAIYQQNKEKVDFESCYIFANLETLENEKVFNLIVNAINLCTEPILVVNCDNQKKDKVTKFVQKFNDNDITQRVIFISDKICFLNSKSNVDITHTWSHLTINFQQKLLQRTINFQGYDVPLGIMGDLSSIESIPFKELLDDGNVTVGENLFKDTSKEYVDRTFLSQNSKLIVNQWPYENYDIQHNFNFLSISADKHKTILLFDEPGMGKSTTFKILQSKLKKKYFAHWIVFMDLKDHCKAFQVDEKITKFIDRETIIEFFCEKILKLQVKNFDAQFFAQLFNDNRVIVLMDGLDEICPSYKRFVFALMVAIQTLSKNQLWISTRPHLVSELTNILHPITFRLKPFTKKDQQTFFKNFFTSRNSQDQNIEQKLREIDELLKKLYIKGSLSISNPLLFKMIAECFDVDDENSKLLASNLFSIYEHFTTKMVDRCMKKGPEARKTLAMSYGKLEMMKFYQKSSFVTCFEHTKRSIQEMINLCFNNVSTPSSDNIARIGLMFYDGSDCFRFIHRTFAEFGVAQFIHKTIFLGDFKSGEYLVATFDVFLEILRKAESHGMILAFIDNALEIFEADKSLKQTKSLLSESSEKLKFRLFEKLVEGGYFNLIKALLIHIHPEPNELLVSRNAYRQNLIMSAVKYQSISFIEKFFELFEEIVGSNSIRKMMRRNDLDQNIFHFAASNRKYSEVFSYLARKIESFISRDELNILMLQIDRNDENVINRALQYSQDLSTLLETLLMNLDNSQLISLIMKKGDNLLHFSLDPENFSSSKFFALIDFMKQVFGNDILQKYLLQRNKNGMTLFGIALNTGCEAFSDVKKAYIRMCGATRLRAMVLNNVFLVLFHKLTNVEDDKGIYESHLKTILMLRDLFEDAQNKASLQKVLQSEDDHGNTCLLFAAKNHTEQNFLALWSVIVYAFNEEEQFKLLLKKNIHGESVVRCVGLNCFDASFLVNKGIFL